MDDDVIIASSYFIKEKMKARVTEQAIEDEERPLSGFMKRKSIFRFDPRCGNISPSDEQLKTFFECSGLTNDDIDNAFDMLSHDKRSIKHSDIKAFITAHFENFPEEAISLLNNWKDEVTKGQMYSMLINKPLMSSPYESALKWFSPEGLGLGKKDLKRESMRLTNDKRIFKRDAQFLLDMFDFDNDGIIGVEDLKRISICKKSTK